MFFIAGIGGVYVKTRFPQTFRDTIDIRLVFIWDLPLVVHVQSANLTDISGKFLNYYFPALGKPQKKLFFSGHSTKAFSPLPST